MNNRRRHADDFTDSLHDFHQTISEELSQIPSQTYLEDSLDADFIKDLQHKGDKPNHSRNNESQVGSIILAGNLARERYTSFTQLLDSRKTIQQNCDTVHSGKQQPLRDMSNISDEISHMSSRPDLNKCINLFYNEHLRKNSRECSSVLSEIKDYENIDPYHSDRSKTITIQYSIFPRALSTNSLKDEAEAREGIKRSKSCVTLYSPNVDTYNKVNHFFCTREIETTKKMNSGKKDKTIVPSVDTSPLPKSLASKEDNSHSVDEDQKCDSNSESMKAGLDPYELRTLLLSLEDQKPQKNEAMQEHLLRRLSITYQNSPRNFTEKLLTIIEESVINDDPDEPLEFPEISMCRLTEELRKMCKFIENETAPEWPQSPGTATSTCAKENQEFKLDLSRRSVNALTSPNKIPHMTVMSSTPRCGVRSPKKINPKSISDVLTKNLVFEDDTHDSTSTFEFLEAACVKLFPDEQKSTPVKSCQSQSPSGDMNHLLRACDNQMASLKDSPSVCVQFKDAATSTSTSEHNAASETSNLQQKQSAHKKCVDAMSKCVLNTPEKRAEYGERYKIVGTDDLENTFMYEIAKKRQRCLDTAKVMMEINATPKSKGQMVSSVVNEVNSPSNNDIKLMETLMSCKRYQNYLREYKPLLNLLQRTAKSRSACDKKIARTGETNKARIATPGKSKFLMTRKKSTSPSPKCHLASNKMVISKPRLFVTPGKTPVRRATKRTYFTNSKTPSKQKEFDLSSQVKSIYRQIGLNYNTVVSPVGMYIRSTDPYLMKNVRSKTDELLLSPRKKQTTPSTTPKMETKFKLSPKQPKEMLTGTTEGNENDKFLHPKVYYKLPSHIQGEKNKKVGNRVNELLRSTKDKVVIRHEGRVKTPQPANCLEPEIRYDSTEESVHIEQTARKTYFSHMQKNH